ncbi:microsomal triglyceride transfer protein large subunit [Plakobranchus ocellatus]|uniref:Microsomal triglyceride transfer protein large subunit n=1 Tax=Plakobranchus ocellatus TaxID=259542 RepID=A0AAV3YDF5_9GAST|nr:microsomal triglyceride transfer protein large subunit [Plakobranchus ocellatus]
MDSNIHMMASVNDQSDSYKTDRTVDLGVEHASRKMGVHHKLSSSALETTSSGKIYWDSDESSKLSYDMQVKDNSRRRKEVKEGHFTLGLPFRTLGLSGSYSDNRVVKSADATFSWDADRDDKQIGLKGTITRGDRIKGDITLSMPAIRKEIRVDGELMSQNGRIILDARTDISYSRDSRKTLTLTSKLEDISDYYSRYNYSLAVGVSHPYTNVDIQMTSHLGSSDEKMTVGLSTDYMNARRQNKNLGLLAEINKLKRQISLQVTNPMNKVEISGGVVSTRPYKDTMFRSELSRIKYGREMTEALLAVRLNTSRLLHTRFHWNPDMAQGLWQAVEERALAGGLVAMETLDELNVAVSEELVGKYTDITNALSEELRPLIDELDKEMTIVARKMNKLSREMRKAYENNDFYIQDMGQSVTEAYMNAQEKLIMYTREYREASSEIIQSLSEGLRELTSYPIKEHYSEMVSSSATWLNERAESILSCLESYLAKADAALTEYHERLQELKQKASGEDCCDETYYKKLGSIIIIVVMP